MQTNFDPNWFEFWIKQSQYFYSTAEKQLQQVLQYSTDMASQETQMKAWLENLQAEWQKMLTAPQTQFEPAAQLAWVKLYQNASTKMFSEWMRRLQANEPIANVHDLYALWLQCCNEVYKDALKEKAFQQATADMININLNYFKSAFVK